MVSACRRLGLDSEGAELIRLGENALWRLRRHPTVVRIARLADYYDDAVKEVAVARWLAAAPFPAAAVVDLPQPQLVDGHPVTFWNWIDGRRAVAAEIRQLGIVLRKLHQLPPPAEFALPPERILDRVQGRV